MEYEHSERVEALMVLMIGKNATEVILDTIAGAIKDASFYLLYQLEELNEAEELGLTDKQLHIAYHMSQVFFHQVDVENEEFLKGED